MLHKHFKQKFSHYKELLNVGLGRLLPCEDIHPSIIHEAMNYSVFAGGKRLRPVLCMDSYGLFDDDFEKILPVACALECIHTYSLIHDDLPCMDDDDFRRGEPTCHKKFGEAIAVLAGDALLTEAFGLVSDFDCKNVVGDIVSELVSACGSRGLIGGQVMDILSENKQLDKKTLDYIHRHKTGKLIVVSVRLGAICAGAGEKDLDALTSYGESLGLAFQISDDLLDVLGDSANLGKQVGQDEKLNKLTYPSLYGIDGSKKRLKDTIDKAISSLEIFNEKACFLSDLAEYVGNRDR